MARRLKKHLQQALFDERGRPAVIDGKVKPQRKRTTSKRGTKGQPKRKPGRKPKGKRAGSPHKARPELKPRFPVHVVLRVVDAIGSMRKRHMYKALREATLAVAKRELNYSETGAFRIVHISIQSNHVHLIVEADHKMALSRGMQSFQISAAKHLNRALSVRSLRVGLAYKQAMATRRRGTVFPDRFHQEIITNPTQARRTLAYVLNNWRKHREDQSALSRTWKVDPFSTGVLFEGWRELDEAQFYLPYRETYLPLVVYLPKTWLLREGWRKAGLGSVPFYEVPSAKQLEAARRRVA
jgi:REP element-mobilizing transposase RayT